jgi:hypothetical protein
MKVQHGVLKMVLSLMDLLILNTVSWGLLMLNIALVMTIDKLFPNNKL